VQDDKGNFVKVIVVVDQTGKITKTTVDFHGGNVTGNATYENGKWTITATDGNNNVSINGDKGGGVSAIIFISVITSNGIAVKGSIFYHHGSSILDNPPPPGAPVLRPGEHAGGANIHLEWPLDPNWSIESDGYIWYDTEGKPHIRWGAGAGVIGRR
jgi:hypothetical protein